MNRMVLISPDRLRIERITAHLSESPGIVIGLLSISHCERAAEDVIEFDAQVVLIDATNQAKRPCIVKLCEHLKSTAPEKRICVFLDDGSDWDAYLRDKENGLLDSIISEKAVEDYLVNDPFAA